MTDHPLSAPSNVVSLLRFIDPPAPNPLRAVEHYWSGLRAGAQIPTRSQVDPRALEEVLRYVFILEETTPGIARFRVAGSHITQLAGIEVRGMPMSAFVRPPARNCLSNAITACLTQPAVIHARMQARSLQNTPGLSGALIMLPLQCESGQLTRVLGAIKVDGKIHSDAYRLDMSDFDAKPVYGTPSPVLPTRCDVAEPPTQFDAAPRLHLVHSNESL